MSINLNPIQLGGNRIQLVQPGDQLFYRHQKDSPESAGFCSVEYLGKPLRHSETLKVFDSSGNLEKRTVRPNDILVRTLEPYQRRKGKTPGEIPSRSFLSVYFQELYWPENKDIPADRLRNLSSD